MQPIKESGLPEFSKFRQFTPTFEQLPKVEKKTIPNQGLALRSKSENLPNLKNTNCLCILCFHIFVKYRSIHKESPLHYSFFGKRGLFGLLWFYELKLGWKKGTLSNLGEDARKVSRKVVIL